MAYAKDTDVSTGRSEGEIRSMLRKAGADSIGVLEGRTEALIVFELHERRIRFRLPLPDRQSKEFTETPSGKWLRDESAADKAWEQACRSRWRGLALCIKAKLESIEAGIETFEDAFLAHVQMPDGQTIGEHVKPQLALHYATGNMPPLIPPPAKGRGKP